MSFNGMESGDYYSIRNMCRNLNITRLRRLYLKVLFMIDSVRALKVALKWIQPGTYLHCKNVERISIALAEEYTRMFRRPINLKILKDAAFFHDVGKLFIPSDVLKKKRLTLHEKRALARHPELGSLILRGKVSPQVWVAVLSHHEEIDGGGYPRGIDDKKLPFLARVISTVDDFCAMTERRVYNDPAKPEEAISEIEKEVGSRYEEGIVRALKLALQKDGRVSWDLHAGTIPKGF